MKTVITLIMSALVSINVYANNNEATTIAKVSGYEQGLKEITLMTNATLKMTTTNDKVSYLRLNSGLFDKLSSEAMGLADAQLADVNKVVVCLMMSIPRLSDLTVATFDFEKNQFTSKQTLVLTEVGCQIHHEVYPLENYALIDAEKLRSALVALALNTIKN